MQGGKRFTSIYTLSSLTYLLIVSSSTYLCLLLPTRWATSVDIVEVQPELFTTVINFLTSRRRTMTGPLNSLLSDNSYATGNTTENCSGQYPLGDSSNMATKTNITWLGHVGEKPLYDSHRSFSGDSILSSLLSSACLIFPPPPSLSSPSLLSCLFLSSLLLSLLLLSLQSLLSSRHLFPLCLSSLCPFSCSSLTFSPFPFSYHLLFSSLFSCSPLLLSGSRVMTEFPD